MTGYGQGFEPGLAVERLRDSAWEAASLAPPVDPRPLPGGWGARLRWAALGERYAHTFYSEVRVLPVGGGGGVWVVVETRPPMLSLHMAAVGAAAAGLALWPAAVVKASGPGAGRLVTPLAPGRAEAEEAAARLWRRGSSLPPYSASLWASRFHGPLYMLPGLLLVAWRELEELGRPLDSIVEYLEAPWYPSPLELASDMLEKLLLRAAPPS